MQRYRRKSIRLRRTGEETDVVDRELLVQNLQHITGSGRCPYCDWPNHNIITTVETDDGEAVMLQCASWRCKKYFRL